MKYVDILHFKLPRPSQSLPHSSILTIDGVVNLDVEVCPHDEKKKR